MEYRQNDWSILGFGCMRFPKKGGSVDMEETERELAYAIAHGVNYFDTAYIYRGNEKVLGSWWQRITGGRRFRLPQRCRTISFTL